MSKSGDVKETLSGAEVHDGWEKGYRNAENEKFFTLAFEYIATVFGKPKEGSLLLDAGCGSCSHSVRLAKYGFNVTAIDYSEYIIDVASQRVNERGLGDRIKVQREDLLGLSFNDETFDYILCWGVLMHIPDVENAVSELSRVLKKGGKLVISEVNMFALEIVATEFLRPFLNKGHIRSFKVKEGIEVWAKTESGDLLSRRMNIQWLINRLKEDGIIVVERKSGQFAESYTRVSNSFIKRSIHRFNNFWFKHLGFPALACGNILVFEKSKDEQC